MRLVIVGGSDAGISAGLRARELDPSAEVVLLLADRFPDYSICGLPFYISGETADWRHLAHRKLPDLEAAGLQLLLEHRATSIDPPARMVRALDPSGRAMSLGYDKLVIGTGAEPARPPIPGLELTGVHLLHTMEDSFRVHDRAVAVRAGSLATALFHGVAVEALSDLDLSYTPPFSAPWDPFQVAAQDWMSSCRATAAS
jgi:NADPH-dependent 2,4-dienoyl-CoA reductase/sulfur reductase-like enzyme